MKAASGNTSCEATRWMSDTALSCVTPSGSGCEASVIITATSQVQTVTNVLTFDAFSLSCTAPSNLAM
eukprot:3933267-Rhodomonas_salina.1